MDADKRYQQSLYFFSVLQNVYCFKLATENNKWTVQGDTYNAFINVVVLVEPWEKI